MRFGTVARNAGLALSVLVGIASAVLPLWPASVSAQTPTPDQLRMYQSLPKEQRDAILQQIGGNRAGAQATAPGQSPNQIVVERSSPTDAAETATEFDPRTGLPRAIKIKGSDQLLIELVLPLPTPLERTPIEQKRLEELRDRILKRNPYDLDRWGVLQLPGFSPISLGGLTAREARERLASEPALRNFGLTVTLLRLDATGVRALKPFGYEIFSAGATALVPGTDIPVPPDYKLGAGDVLGLQLYGQQSQSYSLPVGRDGTISFPELGPIAVGGLGFGAVQNSLSQRVRQQMIGTQARITLTELRTMRVLVLGDAEKPGSYVLGGLSSVTNALFASGGVRRIGSLRTIEVKRGGQLLRRLDLYDALLNGDTSNDVLLQTGDVVFVPPVRTLVTIGGEVQRPAIYELTKEKTLAQVVAIAGGLSPEADGSVVTVERVASNGSMAAIVVDLTAPAGQNFPVQSGDIVRVAMVRPVVVNGIKLEGHVYRPGMYAWRDGLRISDLVQSRDDLQPRADVHYLLVRREAPGSGQLSVFSADLAAALVQRGSGADIPLQPRDRVTVFDTVSPRDQVIEPLLDELRRQSRPEAPTGIVYVEGRVNAPGPYPLEPGMRVSDLLRAGGGLEDAAYSSGAELTSYTVIDGERRRADVRQIDLAAARRGDATADIALQAYDVLNIRVTPEWGRLEQVELVGEFRFPGKYQVRRGESLRSVIERAGGLTNLAFPAGAVFTREELKLREREQLDRLADHLQTDLAGLALQASQSNPAAAQALSSGQGLLDQLRQTKPVGRLVIDLKAIISESTSSDRDVTLRNGDRLVVPRVTQEVSVLGEVQNATSHLYRPGLTRDAVVGLSGGMTPRADKKRAYVVRADGSVVSSSSRWFAGSDIDLHPGDTVVVPLDAERMRPLPLWTAVTTIVYNLAIAATAIGRL
jgi:polysaccharide export outer membrane protein